MARNHGGPLVSTVRSHRLLSVVTLEILFEFPGPDLSHLSV